DNVREGFLEHKQYAILRDELPGHQKLILVIGYHFGMRRGEILNLRWDQVDWDGNVIRLEKRQTKGKKARVAPLYGELRAWLEMAYAARDPECSSIVSWRGHGISEVKTAWQKARVRAGVPDLLIHDLRRTAARNMIRAGVPERQVLDIVGWKTRTMLDRYNIIDERDVHAAGEKMARYLEERERAAEEHTTRTADGKVRTKVRTAESEKEAAESIKTVYLQ
ncbi:MAG: site-specific integrase, partial [Bryobacteraceae bacterium]